MLYKITLLTVVVFILSGCFCHSVKSTEEPLAKTHFVFPKDAERNHNRAIGPFCCTGRTLSIEHKDHDKPVGYVYYFSWGGGQAYNRGGGKYAVFPRLEMLVAGAHEYKADNPHPPLMKTSVVFPANKASFDREFKVKAGCVLYTFSNLRAELVSLEGKSGMYIGSPENLELDVETSLCDRPKMGK